jgi:hypothetical protein
MIYVLNDKLFKAFNQAHATNDLVLATPEIFDYSHAYLINYIGAGKIRFCMKMCLSMIIRSIRKDKC